MKKIQVNKAMITRNVKRYGPVAVAAVATAAGAQSTGDTSGIDFTSMATKGVAVIGAAGAAGATLLLARNGLKIAVKWAKSLVGMA